MARQADEWRGAGASWLSFAACQGASASVLAVASVLGCDAQVDGEYTGEALFSLQGRVVVREDAGDTDLVPRIAFSEGDTTVLIGGRVTGEFPAKFRLDITQPPPRTAIFSAVEAGRAAIGFLVLVPEDYPERVVGWLETEVVDEQCDD